MTIKEQILNYPNFFFKNGRVSSVLTRKNSDFLNNLLYKNITNETLFLKDTATFPERVYCIINEHDKPITCLECDKLVNFRNFLLGYRVYCSSKCKCKSSDYKIKKAKTTLDRYGDANYTNRKKAEKTTFERYGVDNYFKSPYFLEQSDNTKLLRYGEKRYTNRHKSIGTCIKKYGVINGSQAHLPANSISKINVKEWLIQEYVNSKRSVSSISAELNLTTNYIRKMLRKFKIRSIQNARSNSERELYEYINTLYDTEIIIGDRKLIKPYELDFVLPEYNLAIEFNGRHWHSPAKYESITKWKEYHSMKVDKCKKIGITLLHLWEDYKDHTKLINDAILGQVDNNLDIILKEVDWTGINNV